MLVHHALVLVLLLLTLCLQVSKDMTALLNKVHGAQACGSGGTAAGMALGIQLSGLGCKLHAMGVCDDPQYFYDYIDGLLKGMGVDNDTVGESLKLVIVCAHSMIKK